MMALHMDNLKTLQCSVLSVWRAIWQWGVLEPPILNARTEYSNKTALRKAEDNIDQSSTLADGTGGDLRELVGDRHRRATAGVSLFNIIDVFRSEETSSRKHDCLFDTRANSLSGS